MVGFCEAAGRTEGSNLDVGWGCEKKEGLSFENENVGIFGALSS